MSVLKVENLSYFYDSGEGIRNISFELDYGDCLALIGKSGAGKSTLINSILGILPRQEGTVLIDDSLDIKDISFSPQNQAIDWYLDVFDNVFLESLFSGSENAKAETYAVLEKIGLGGKEEEDPTNLSGGQLQRVQLARQLVSKAKILILDEPTSSLDIVTSENVLNKLSSQCKDGKICIISSHDLDMLEKYCNKVLYIDNGEMVFFGEIDSFLQRYNHLNEYKIFYHGQLSKETKTLIGEAFNVFEWNPLTVEIQEGRTLNSLLKLLIEQDIELRLVEQNSRSLKEIIQLKG